MDYRLVLIDDLWMFDHFRKVCPRNVIALAPVDKRIL